MLRFAPSFTLCFILLLSWFPATAQIAARIPIDIGVSVVFMLDGESPTVFAYDAKGGEVVTIIARSLHELQEGEIEAVRDTILYVLTPGGKLLAYNDNHHGERADLLASDAVIEKLVLSDAGQYLIYVNTYGGIFASEVELSVQAADLFNVEIVEEGGSTFIQAVLPRSHRYRYTFEAAAGETIIITARDISHTLDPILRLVDGTGQVLAMNDDHDGDDLTLDVLDARLEILIPADGEYTVTVVDFLGRGGRFELAIERE